MGFTDFDPPAPSADVEDLGPPPARRAPGSRRDDFYDTPIVDGKPAPNTPVTRLRDRLRALFVRAAEREEAQLETSLRRLPGVSRTNVVATLSPKGGCGKTTSTFLAGNVLASHLRLRVLAVDLNPDFGTLADLAPDRARASLSLVDLLRDKESIDSPGELRPYVSRLPSGLHLLAAPPDPAVMAQMTPELYGELLAFLRRFYEVILLDLGTGVTAPIATFAVDHADQVVVVTTPE
jgi:Flp pilus assembly CpaE family ATPase